MDQFAAESFAWRIKALGDEISHDAKFLALGVKAPDDIAELRRRSATIKKLAISVEKVAAQLDAALNAESHKEPANV